MVQCLFYSILFFSALWIEICCFVVVDLDIANYCMVKTATIDVRGPITKSQLVGVCLGLLWEILAFVQFYTGLCS